MEGFFSNILAASGILMAGVSGGAVAGAALTVVGCLVFFGMSFFKNWGYSQLRELAAAVIIVACVFYGVIFGSILGALVALSILVLRGEVLFGIPLLLLFVPIGCGVLKKYFTR